MNPDKADNLGALVTKLEENRKAVAAAELTWKELRSNNRAMTLQLITEFGISVAKASLLSGHHRATIKIWLNVWNAEQKGRLKEN